MQIIYAKPIHEKITEARLAARKENKEIEKIILTRSEWDKLQRELRGYTTRSRFLINTPAALMFDGIELEVGEEF